MTWDGLRYPNRRWALCLTVSGLDVRYYDIASPPSTTIHRTGRQYVDRPGLIDVSGVNDSYSIEGGVAEHSAHTITLSTRGRYAEDEYDPGVVFGRLTNRSAVFASRVTVDIPQATSSTTIWVEDDPSSVSTPCLVHVDSESFWATGTVGGTPGRFTGCIRAAARTQYQAHTINETIQDYPELTTEVVHWRTRWATVYAAPVYDNGDVGDWVELVHGFIDSTPEVDTAGNTVTVQLAPLTALLDNELAPPQGATTETTLASGYHEFNYPEASVAEHVQWMAYANAQDPGDPTVLTIAGQITQTVDNTQWNNAFDWATGLAVDHPRTGAVLTVGTRQAITGYAAGIYTAPNMPGALNNDGFRSAQVSELKQKFLADSASPQVVMQWPDEAFGAINSTSTGWSSDTITGTGGSWLEARIDPSRSKITCNRNIKTGGASTRFGNVGLYFSVIGRQGNVLGYRYFEDSGEDEPLDWQNSPPSRGATPENRLYYPFAFPNAVVKEATSRLDFKVGGQSLDIGIIYPSAFYQMGERFILTADNLTIPTSGRLKVRLKYRPVDVTGAAGDEEIVQFTAISSTAVTYGGSTVGYRLEIDPDDVGRVPSFGEWEGLDSPTLTAVATWDDASSADVMTQILTSSGGNGINGAADVLPFGAALPGSIAPTYSAWGAAEFVDINSFYQYPGPSSVEKWTLFYEGGETLRDIIDSIGRATSTLIVMQRRPDGSCRLRRVPVAASGSYESVGAIQEGDWLADRPPTSGVDDRIVTRHVYKINHDENGDPQLPVTIIDNRALRTHGESATYELDIRGLKLEDPSGTAPVIALRPLYSRISRILGDERRVWRGSISTAQAALMQLGGVYTITSSHLRGYSDEMGVSGETARLKSLSFGFTTEGADVEFVYLAQNATGWNAALKVTSIVDPVTVVVAANEFTGPNNPASGDLQTDLDFFAQGDTVRVVPTADHDAFVTLTIDGITPATREVEFSGAHGLSAPLYGTVEPAIYTSAAAQHKTLAFLADTTPNLGASDPAQEIS